MKVFVYSKKTSKPVAVILDVTKVTTLKRSNVIRFTTLSDEIFEYDINQFKTTIYQN